jgi:hypothetical protein
MVLYFKTGKNRLAFDTDKKIYCDNYFLLGGYKKYIKISSSDYNELRILIDDEQYTYSENI